ncbi:MAG: recombination protein NinG [candidate division Zixibacteria bacterium]|nr:recombination protein NinG [candidate division Zixibacteria bacterium]
MTTIQKLAKRKSIAKLKKEVWDIFSQYVRMRDCLRTRGTVDFGNCITCTKLVRRNEADAGHFIDRRHSATLFDEKNVHLQCKHCNITGETLKYRREIIRLYGEGADVELEDKATEIKKFTTSELEDLKQLYKEKIKEMEG